MKKRVLIAILAALIVFAGVLAMAASLGGITSSTVGADDTVVASCDTNGVTASYATAWEATDERYEIRRRRSAESATRATASRCP